jgi:molybdate transport system ATP-binding protein
MTLEFEAAMRLGNFDYEARFEARNEIVVLFGHSGAGKSVTLQIAAGLLKPECGHIVIDGATVFDSSTSTNLPPQDRSVGYVVQELALFPHMTVAQNVGFAVPRTQDRAKRVEQLLKLFNISEFAQRKPDTLSGGQRQRVALARALARDAQLLLLDEPFSALDDSLRASLRRELLRLRAELGLSIVFVTHDLREAHLLADRLAVFDDGRLLQFAPREDVFRRPLNRRVAELTGVSNIFEGRVVSTNEASTTVDAAGLRLTCECAPVASAGSTVDVCIRAERVILRRIGTGDAPNLLKGTVVEEFAYGATHTLRLLPDGPGPTLEVEIAARPYEVLGIAAQKTWTLELPAADLHIMPRGG